MTTMEAAFLQPQFGKMERNNPTWLKTADCLAIPSGPGAAAYSPFCGYIQSNQHLAFYVNVSQIYVKKNSTSIEEINSSYTIFSLSLLHCVFCMLQNPYPTKSSQWPHICWACQSHEIYISTFSYYLFYKLSTYVYIAESRTNIPDSLCVFVGNLSFLTHSRLTESKSLQIAH